MRARDKGSGGGSEMGSETEEHKSRTKSLKGNRRCS